jgi:hypothetical protein
VRSMRNSPGPHLASPGSLLRNECHHQRVIDPMGGMCGELYMKWHNMSVLHSRTGQIRAFGRTTRWLESFGLAQAQTDKPAGGLHGCDRSIKYRPLPTY